MRKLLYILLSVVFFTILSCDNIEKKTDNNKKGDEISSNTSKIEIKYLEDFMQFENHEQMAEYFGEENVEETILWKAEGTVEYNVSILNPEYSNRVVVYWGMEGETDGADFVETTYSIYTYDGDEAIEGGDVFSTTTQVKVGTSMAELQEINGEAYSFYGLAWDFGGAVIDLNPNFDDYQFYLGSPSIDKMTDWPDDYYKIVGDVELSSENSDALEMELEVVSIAYMGEQE